MKYKTYLNQNNTMGLFIFQLLLLASVTYGLKSALGNNSLSLSVLIVILVSWLNTMWLTHKHKPKIYQRKLKYVLASFPRALIIQLLFTFVGLLLIQESAGVIRLVSSIIVLYAVIEYIFMIFWVQKKLSGTQGERKADIARYSQSDLDQTIARNIIPKESFNTNINNNQLATYCYNLYKSSITKSDSTDEPGKLYFGSLEKLSESNENDYSLLIITNRINDLFNINHSLMVCYNRLAVGGLIIVNYNSIQDTYFLLKQKYSKVLFPFIFPFHWLFYRVISKTKLKSVQDWISRGKNKVISWVEVTGRLAYCGFDVESEERFHNKQYVIARKTKTISNNPNPSYYILIKLNRVSLYGNIIKINKVRSMYPYSEFLQKMIFEQNNMGNTGKVQDDPRITPQGKIFRKYWIDELPQFLDWLRGEIKLVGIRAMSQHFFSLYSQEYKDKYLQVKPGIISPIFDEKTDAFKDIERIEYSYLDSYLKNPLLTDWKYFWITFKHILSGVRSK
jgi:lipopolysaccharide/colanic/teichoic acid biosynthesis glycosyltransferase